MSPDRFRPFPMALALGGALFLLAAASTPGEARSVRHAAHVNINHHFNGNVHIDSHKGHVDIDRNVHRNVHRDVDVDWDRHHYHPVATGVAVGTAAAITAAAIGSVVYALPSGCGYQVINGVRYYHCGGVWYEQRYSGSQLTYVVVPAP